MLRTTPFNSRTAPLSKAQNWRRWSGYLAASSYELHHDREYWAIRNSAALIDVSPLYKYGIEGPDAERFLDRVVTRDVTKCKLHQVLYTPWCAADGKVMDDGTLARLAYDSFRLTSAEPNLRWLLDNALGMDVSIRDITDDLAALALQGPRSREILSSCVGRGPSRGRPRDGSCITPRMGSQTTWASSVTRPVRSGVCLSRSREPGIPVTSVTRSGRRAATRRLSGMGSWKPETPT